MNELSTIKLNNAQMRFAAGHFTIFSATERERLHGHNYTVSVEITTRVNALGLSFDYRYYQGRVIAECKKIHQSMLLPQLAPDLKIKDKDEYYSVEFNHEQMLFLKSDVTLLPVTNITIEELSRWFLQQLSQDTDVLSRHRVEQITLAVSNGPGQSAAAKATFDT